MDTIRQKGGALMGVIFLVIGTILLVGGGYVAYTKYVDGKDFDLEVYPIVKPDTNNNLES